MTLKYNTLSQFLIVVFAAFVIIVAATLVTMAAPDVLTMDHPILPSLAQEPLVADGLEIIVDLNNPLTEDHPVCPSCE